MDSITDQKQQHDSIGSLLWGNPEAILQTVSHFKASNQAIECQLRGGSMETSIPRGASVRISLNADKPYQVGDIIAFVEGKGIWVHRVAYRGSRKRKVDYLITRGDACFYPDPPIKCNRVLGRVTHHFDRDGWTPTMTEPGPGRSTSLIAKTLLIAISVLLEINAGLARTAAKKLRIRQQMPLQPKVWSLNGGPRRV